MPSPFPGMDPYLETPLLWPDVHHELISQIRAALNLYLPTSYVARVELRVYVSDQDDPGREALVPDVRVESAPVRKKSRKAKEPAVAVAEPMIIPVLIDEEIKEARIEIRHIESESLVSVIEVLSPTNKIKGSQGRVSFMEKRQDIWQSKVHWVEIDLLRAGEPSIVHPPLVPSDYRILVCRGGHYGRGRYGPFSVRQPLPAIKIPLRQPDPDMTLDLGAVFRETYEHGAYERSVDYRHEPDPPLNPEDRAWADKLLRAKKQRR